MAKLTQKELLTDALLAEGWKRDVNSKVLTHETYFRQGCKTRVYVGKAGSLRVSPTGRKADSKPARESWKRSLLERGGVVKAEKAMDKFLGL